MSSNPQSTHTLYILGNAYTVPAGFTIMTCMEYAGFTLTRGCGCRGGTCGACAVVYRVGNEAWQAGLACQTLTQDHMVFMFLPYLQGQEGLYDANTTPCTLEAIEAVFPALARCSHCNTCSKSCPLGLNVLAYVHALCKGNFEKVRTLSFECIQCGMCAVRCPQGLTPFAMALMVRRLLSKGQYRPTVDFLESLTKAQNKHWQAEIEAYKALSHDELIKVYQVFQASKGSSGVKKEC